MSLGAGVGACRATYANAALAARTDELALHLGVRRVVDFSSIGLAIGVDTGISWLHQSFDTEGSAPERDSLAAHFGAAGEELMAVFAWRPLFGAGKRF